MSEITFNFTEPTPLNEFRYDLCAQGNRSTMQSIINAGRLRWDKTASRSGESGCSIFKPKFDKTANIAQWRLNARGVGKLRPDLKQQTYAYIAGVLGAFSNPAANPDDRFSLLHYDLDGFTVNVARSPVTSPWIEIIPKNFMDRMAEELQLAGGDTKVRAIQDLLEFQVGGAHLQVAQSRVDSMQLESRGIQQPEQGVVLLMGALAYANADLLLPHP